jgi:hypothetical protein
MIVTMYSNDLARHEPTRAIRLVRGAILTAEREARASRPLRLARAQQVV